MELGLSPGIILVVGDNGVGKTNLLEALHVGTQGFSPRTRSEGQLLRFGEREALLSLEIDRSAVRHRVTRAFRRQRRCAASSRRSSSRQIACRW